MAVTDSPVTRLPEEMRNILLAEYQEVCKSHAGITDFRAKLLALLPIASGTGVVLALQANPSPGLLVALGIFGALVTVGLFLYELRQIDVCKQLRNHAQWIEERLGIEAGQFGGRRERLSLREVYSPRSHRQRDKNLKEKETSGVRESPPEKQRGLLRKPLIGAEAAGYLIYHVEIVAWLSVTVVGAVNLF